MIQSQPEAHTPTQWEYRNKARFYLEKVKSELDQFLQGTEKKKIVAASRKRVLS